MMEEATKTVMDEFQSYKDKVVSRLNKIEGELLKSIADVSAGEQAHQSIEAILEHHKNPKPRDLEVIRAFVERVCERDPFFAEYPRLHNAIDEELAAMEKANVTSL